MKIKELIKNGVEILKENRVEDGSIKANQILQYVLKEDKNYLKIHEDIEVEKQKELEYTQYIKELIKGKPLQYITHEQEFMGLKFYVDENVLIPQPDTEILVEEATHIIEKKIQDHLSVEENSVKKGCNSKMENYKGIRILDLCTGSGAIAISLAKYLKTEQERKQGEEDRNYAENKVMVEVYGADISKEALEIARKNAQINEVEVKWILSDMFEGLVSYQNQFDMIVSNPPYIETSVIETLSKEVQNEPHLALNGGEDGSDFYKIIAKQAYGYLRENSDILLEIGYRQKESVTKLFRRNETIWYNYMYKRFSRK